MRSIRPGGSIFSAAQRASTALRWRSSVSALGHTAQPVSKSLSSSARVNIQNPRWSRICWRCSLTVRPVKSLPANSAGSLDLPGDEVHRHRRDLTDVTRETSLDLEELQDQHEPEQVGSSLFALNSRSASSAVQESMKRSRSHSRRIATRCQTRLPLRGPATTPPGVQPR